MTKIKNWTLSKVAAVQARNTNEEGQGLAEYGLILALIAVVCILATSVACALNASAATLLCPAGSAGVGSGKHVWGICHRLAFSRTVGWYSFFFC